MSRSAKLTRPSSTAWLSLSLALLTLLPSTGCLHLLLASSIYLWEGGNLVPAECDELENKRVVVFCRPPAAHEYRHAGAARELAKRISSLLEINVPGIEVVNPREVDNWMDENDSDDFRNLGKAVKADRVVQVELDHFDLFKGPTLYQGSSDVTISVYNMEEKGKLVWDRDMGEMLFPVNSGIPAQDKPVRQFQKEYVGILSESVAKNFYKHDPNASFAIDALANR